MIIVYSIVWYPGLWFVSRAISNKLPDFRVFRFRRVIQRELDLGVNRIGAPHFGMSMTSKELPGMIVVV